LKKELQELGYVFEGQTGSAVIAKLIDHYYYKNGEERLVKEATNQALKRCHGTWGLYILCADAPDELVVACDGSPLFIGLGDDQIYVASEVRAFSWYTRNYIMMKDGEIGVLAIVLVMPVILVVALLHTRVSYFQSRMKVESSFSIHLSVRDESIKLLSSILQSQMKLSVSFIHSFIHLAVVTDETDR
jgi:asparagine synthetase B (glutamine-hydrolysing)